MGEAKRKAQYNPNGKGGGEMWVEKRLMLKKEGVNVLTALHQKAKDQHEKDIPEHFVDFLAYCVYAGADLVGRALDASANVLVKAPTAQDMANIRQTHDRDLQGGYRGRRTR